MTLSLGVIKLCKLVNLRVHRHLLVYEKVPAFRRTILHVINAPDSGVVLTVTVAVIVKKQTSARVIISNLK